MVFQPLNDKFSIVNPDGTPNQYFIRLFQQRGIQLDNSITAEEAQALIDAWATQRDIIAGVGLSGGGNLSNDVTIDLDAYLDDLNDVDLSIPPTNGQVLTYDSVSGTWKAGAGGAGGGGGALVPISQVLVSTPVNVITFASIPNTYDDLFLSCSARQSVVGGVMRMQFNGDTGNNYDSYRVNRFGTTQSATNPGIDIGSPVDPAVTANYFNPTTCDIFDYKNTTTNKSVKADNSVYTAATNYTRQQTDGWWRNTAAISQVDIRNTTGNFVAGSVFTLYGRSKTPGGGGGGGGISYYRYPIFGGEGPIDAIWGEDGESIYVELTN